MIERLDTWAAVHPGWRDRLRRACIDGGYGLQSVWRSYNLQARWYWCAQNGCPGGRGCHGTPGNCPGANRPGNSNHEWAEFVPAHTTDAALADAGLVAADRRAEGVLVPASLAVDVYDGRGDNFTWLHRVAGSYGLVFTIARERWHVQPLELKESYQTGSPFLPLVSYLKTADPWADLFVPLLTD